MALRAWPLDDATDLFAVRVGMSWTGCYVGSGYARTRGVPVTLADLAKHDCIVVGSATTSWSFRVGGKDERVPVSARIRVDSFRLACSLAERGAGVVRAARTMGDRLVQTGALVPVLERYWPRTPVHAVHAGRPAPPKVRVFIDLARDAVTRFLAPI